MRHAREHTQTRTHTRSRSVAQNGYDPTLAVIHSPPSDTGSVDG